MRVLTPTILHDPVCGFENFWARYQTRGRFPDAWFGQVLVAPRIGLSSWNRATW